MKIVEFINNKKDELGDVLYAFIILLGTLFCTKGYWAADGAEERLIIEGIVCLCLVILFCSLKVKFKIVMGVATVACGVILWPCYLQITLLLIAAVGYLLAHYLNKYRIIRYVLWGGVTIAIIVFLWRKVAIDKRGVAFIYCFEIVNIIWLIEYLWKKKRLGKNMSYVIMLWPVWAAFMVTLLFTPAPEKPYDWALFKKGYEVVARELSNIYEKLIGQPKEDFDMKMSGFSDNGEIGGSIFDSDTLALYVRSNHLLTTNLYLKGLSFEDFDGREWKSNIKYDSRKNKIDIYESVYALYMYDENLYNDCFLGTELAIIYQNMKTTYYFMPIKTMSIVPNDEKFFDISFNNDKIYTQHKKSGDGYRVYFYQININSELLGKLMMMDITDDPKVWKRVVQKFRAGNVSFEELLEYRGEIKGLYGQPVEISENMKKWVDSVTTGCTNKLERLQAISNALRKLEYCKEVGELPDTVKTPADFLDYFILDSKKGYCTYFATAFVLLARYEGFPARYVQGFCVDMEGGYEKGVSGKMAHAWPEVYIDGVGFIPFEPTASYNEISYVPWLYEESANEIYIPVFNNDDIVEETGDEHKTGIQVDFGRLIPILLGSLLGAMIIVIIVDGMINRRKYLKKSLSERLRFEIGRNIIVYGKLGLTKRMDETIEELDNKVKIQYEEWKLSAPRSLENYERVIYGNLGVTENMIILARSDREQVLSSLGRLNCIYEKYWLYITRSKP